MPVFLDEVPELKKTLPKKYCKNSFNNLKSRLKSLLSVYRDEILSGTQPCTVSAKEVSKQLEHRAECALFNEPIRHRTALRFAQLILPYKSLLQRQLPMSLSLLGNKKEGYRYAYVLMQWISALKDPEQLGYLINPKKYSLEETQRKMVHYLQIFDNVLVTSKNPKVVALKISILNAMIQQEYFNKSRLRIPKTSSSTLTMISSIGTEKHTPKSSLIVPSAAPLLNHLDTLNHRAKSLVPEQPSTSSSPPRRVSIIFTAPRKKSLEPLPTSKLIFVP